MKELDEKGFVFIAKDGKPYWCKMYQNEPWFLYWNEGQKCWVTLQTASTQMIMHAYARRVPDDYAQKYHDLNDEFTKQFSS